MLGRLPNTGANDGALLFDIDQCERWDARPTLAVLGAPHTSMPATELDRWFPPDRIELPGANPSTQTAYHALKGRRSLLLTHIGVAERHRSGHGDQQAIELIIDGEPVVLDPGTFRYSARSPWQQPFVGPGAHSALALISERRKPPRSRFLHTGMPCARVVRYVNSDEEQLVSRRIESGVSLTRTIRRFDDSYTVVDTVSSGSARVRWVLNEADLIAVDEDSVEVTLRRARVRIEGGIEQSLLERSDDDPLSGWWSPLYGHRLPATVVEVTIDAGRPSSASIESLGAASSVRSRITSLVSSSCDVVAVESDVDVADSNRDPT